MQMTCSFSLKQELDSVSTFEDAELVVSRAIEKADRAEILKFIRELYEEFVGPDDAGGGCSGTLQHIRTLTEAVSPTDTEVSSWGFDPSAFRSVLRHV